MAADGQDFIVMVPSARSMELAQAGSKSWSRPASPRGSAQRPHVVALYEDGLLDRLETLGLPAYVGVAEDQDWDVIHWGTQAGAILLPVASGRDLVDAVADHTLWAEFAGPDSEPTVPGRRRHSALRRSSPWPEPQARCCCSASQPSPQQPPDPHPDCSRQPHPQPPR